MLVAMSFHKRLEKRLVARGQHKILKRFFVPRDVLNLGDVKLH